MEKHEKIALIVDAFNQMRVRGIVKTQGDFARLLGVSQNSISGARNGDERYLTDSMVERVQALVNSIPEVAPHVAVQAREDVNGIFIPQKTLDLYTSLAKTCDRLSAIVDRMLAADPAAAKKTYSADVRQ